MIAFEHVGKAFADCVAIDDLSLTIVEGEFVENEVSGEAAGGAGVGREDFDAAGLAGDGDAGFENEGVDGEGAGELGAWSGEEFFLADSQ